MWGFEEYQKMPPDYGGIFCFIVFASESNTYNMTQVKW